MPIFESSQRFPRGLEKCKWPFGLDRIAEFGLGDMLEEGYSRMQSFKIAIGVAKIRHPRPARKDLGGGPNAIQMGPGVPGSPLKRLSW